VLSQSELTVVIIQTLLGYSDLSGRFLQVHAFMRQAALTGGDVQLPPSFNQVNYLSNSPFLAPGIFLLLTFHFIGIL
jgi:hypothetical protein